MIKENAKLAACGCGGVAYIEEMMDSTDALHMKIVCSRCGMTLDHTQDFAYSNAGRVAINPSAIEVWNDCHKEKCDAGYAEGVKEGLASLDCEVKKAYNKGLQDAWELVRKLYLGGKQKYSPEEQKEIFGGSGITYVIEHYTPQEALAKLEAYEQEIKVGDVVTNPKHTVEILVTADYGTYIDGIKITPDDDLGRMGGVYSGTSKSGYIKTGRHIDIQQILAEVGKE